MQLSGKYDVFTFTLPGHDKLIIDNVTKSNWINESENQINYITNNKYKSIIVIGYSMGGVIAVHLASKYKEISKLILAAPAFKYMKFKNNKFSIKESLKLFPDILKTYNLKEIFIKLFKVPFKTVNEFIDLVKDNTSDINNVTCPTLILWGDEDKVVPYESPIYVYVNIKGAAIMVEIKGGNHDVFINNRYNEIKDIILKFLSSIDISYKIKISI